MENRSKINTAEIWKKFLINYVFQNGGVVGFIRSECDIDVGDAKFPQIGTTLQSKK